MTEPAFATLEWTLCVARSSATSSEGSSSKDQDLDSDPTPKAIHGRGLAPRAILRQTAQHRRVRSVPPRVGAARLDQSGSLRLPRNCGHSFKRLRACRPTLTRSVWG